MVKQLAQHPKVDSFNPARAAGTGREKMKKSSKLGA
jgi:hypothetical protein